jgi:hypothetical protein
MRYVTLAVVAALVAPSLPLTVGAGEAPKPIPELKVLEQTIGTWDEVLTNKPAEWNPKAERSTSVTRKQWALGGRFIRMEGVWNPAKAEFVSLVTYDPATSEYRTWYFDARGGFPRGDVRGKWDEKARTMTWTGTDEFGNKSVGKTKIIDKDSHEWTVVTRDPKGKVVLDIQGKNTRRKE